MCVINFTSDVDKKTDERKISVNAMYFKFGRTLVVLLNVTLMLMIVMIVSEFYGVVIFRNGGYTEWTPFSKCSVSCGGGVRVRSRTCTSPEPSLGGKNCHRFGEAVEVIACNTRGCPIDGGFERWSNFAECSASCGGGTQKRIRYCINPVPKFGGKDCYEQGLGPYEEERICNEQPCQVDGGYSDWTDWTPCSATCGKGEKKRSRTCDNPTPSVGGSDCTNLGPAEEILECSTPCPKNGGYGDWTDWGTCSVTCGGGWRTRTRACDSPPPQNGGKTCLQMGYGNPEDTKPCNEERCDLNGGYGEWSLWSECNKSCGGGRMERTRQCNNPSPVGGGKSCRDQGLGASIEADECNLQDCTTSGKNLVG